MGAFADVDAVRAWLGAHAYTPRAGDPRTGRVGLELEMLPFWVARAGGPAARLALVEVIGIVDEVEGAIRNPDAGDGRPSWTLDGALVTEEPGAQVEVAGPPLDSAETAVAHLESVVDRLSSAFDEAGAALVAVGLDQWSAPDAVPVQLQIPRYEAMTSYFDRRGGRHGHVLMCSSCSLQVNVDLGPPDVAPRRWLLANLLAPVLTAAFATSPGDQVVNARALSWRGLDPTRTGLAPPLLAGDDDPLDHVLADVLRADVLVIERDGEAVPGRPGWSFGDWVDDGHPHWGRPTPDDLAVHMTTLFGEARLRGFCEVRGIDAMPAPWRGAAVAMVTTLLYDPLAMDTALALLVPHRADMAELIRRAAGDGLADAVVGALAVGVLDTALHGLVRARSSLAEQAIDFCERFTHRGRHPGGELAAMAEDPVAGFAWARC